MKNNFKKVNEVMWPIHGLTSTGFISRRSIEKNWEKNRRFDLIWSHKDIALGWVQLAKTVTVMKNLKVGGNNKISYCSAAELNSAISPCLQYCIWFWSKNIKEKERKNYLTLFLFVKNW